MMYSMCVVYWAYSSSAHSLEANDHAAHSVDNGIWLASLTTDSGSCQLQLHCFATLCKFPRSPTLDLADSTYKHVGYRRLTTTLEACVV